MPLFGANAVPRCLASAVIFVCCDYGAGGTVGREATMPLLLLFCRISYCAVRKYVVAIMSGGKIHGRDVLRLKEPVFDMLCKFTYQICTL